MADAAIESLFAAYADGLNDFDAEAIVDLFVFPTTIWQFGKGYVFADREDLLENVDALLAAFDGAGVVTSSFEVEAVTSHENNASSAYAVVLWTQENADGEAIHEFRCTYLLLLDADEWFIATVINEADED